MAITINVKAAGGGSKPLSVEPTMSVPEFKALVTSEFGTPADRQRIVFSGHVLEDAKKLSDYDIGEGATVHVVTVQQRGPAAAPTPRAAPAGAGGMGGMLPPGINMGELQQMMSTPQGQMMMQQIMSNPDILRQIMQSNPGLANNPEAQAMLQNPDFLQMMANPGNLAQMLGGMAGGPIISRDVVNVAIDCMNGAPIPDEYRMAMAEMMGGEAGAGAGAGVGAGAGGVPAAAAAPREFVPRAVVFAAIDEAVGRMGGAVAAPPSPAVGGSGSMQTDDNVPTPAPAPTTTTTTTTAPATTSATPAAPPAAAAPTPTPAPASSAMDTEQAPPPSQYDAELEQLASMGFVDRQRCLEALTAAGGDVTVALTFLTD